MIGLTELWMPILVSALFVFVASAIIHMALRYHWSDWEAPPGEDDFAGAPQGTVLGANGGSSIKEAPVFCLVALCATAAGCLVLFFFADDLYQLLTPIVSP